MRKILALGVFLIAASLAFAEPIQYSTGLLASWSPLVLDDQTVIMTGTTMSMDSSFAGLGLRAFFDFTYGEVSIGYSGAVTKLNVKVSALGTSMSANVDWAISVVDLRLVGKYPVYFDSFTLFPLIGLEKYLCLSGSEMGVTFTSDDKSDLSPWFLLAGVEGDFKIANQLYVRTQLTAAYNLTSKRRSAYYTGVTYQSSYGWEIQVAAGIGYSF
jgi:hypothetical protein